jgi:hypothetical protein
MVPAHSKKKHDFRVHIRTNKAELADYDLRTSTLSQLNEKYLLLYQKLLQV